MKKYFLILSTCIFLFSCSDNSNKSAFTGEKKEATTAPVGTLSKESLYSISDTFQTQDKQEVTLKQFEGKPTVVGMIFTHCTYACPRLTADIKNIEDSLKQEKGNINFVLVSFDADRDTPAQLKKFAQEQG
ncbi:MAG: SCO family protein, partial [Ginsengibacter sp.]